MEEVVCTGIGIISPAGVDKKEFWHSVNEIPLSSQGLNFVKFEDDQIWMIEKPKRRTYTTRISEMALAAGIQALDDAGIELSEYDPARIGVVVGTGYGNFWCQADVIKRLFRQRPAPVPPRSFSRVIHSEIGGVFAIEMNLQGINVTVSQGEASAETAICLAVQYLKDKRADILVVIGADECHPVFPHCILHDEAERSSCAASGCKGSVLGEGAGALVLEAGSHASYRSAYVYGRIVDFSITYNDIVSSVNEALTCAALSRMQIDYIASNIDICSVRSRWETVGLMEVFGEQPFPVLFNSLAEVTGCFPASGIMRIIASFLAMQSDAGGYYENSKTELKKDIHYILQSCFVPSSSTVSIIIENTN